MTEEQQNENPRSVMIVEDDDSLSAMLFSELKSIGINTIDCFNNGEDAWEASKNNYYDFIILDWKIPKLSSLALYNRLKNDKAYKHIPILVISGFLGKKDFSLLSEYPNTNNIEKPFSMNFLIKKIKILKKESLWYIQKESEINSLLDDMEEKKNVATEDLLKMIEQAPNPLPVALFFGKALRQRHLFPQAEEVLKTALKFSENIVALGELGKIYLQTGRLKEAKSLFERAVEKSPDNLERLCQLGEIKLQELDTEGASMHFNQALAIDPQSAQAQGGITLTSNMAKWLVSTVAIPSTFAGILNAIGINLVRSSDFSAGIEHYNSALLYVGDDLSKAKLAFNLGLGFLRWGKNQEAFTWFQNSSRYSQDFKKAEKYIVLLTEIMGLAVTPRAEALPPGNHEMTDKIEIFHSDLSLAEPSKIDQDLDLDIEMI